MLEVQILPDFWQGWLLGLVSAAIVAGIGGIMTLFLQSRQHRMEAYQKRMDRIRSALYKLQPKLAGAKGSYRKTDVPLIYSAVQQAYLAFEKEIMYMGLLPELSTVSPTLVEALKRFYVAFFRWQAAFEKMEKDQHKEPKAYFEELREAVVRDSEIKKLIQELAPMVNTWLVEHP